MTTTQLDLAAATTSQDETVLLASASSYQVTQGSDPIRDAYTQGATR